MLSPRIVAALFVLALIPASSAYAGSQGFPSEQPSLPWACNPKTYDAKLCDEAMKDRATAPPPTMQDTPDDRWSVRCQVDHVTAKRRCWAGAFGRAMAATTGEGYGRKMYPFQISYIDTEGPYLFTPNTFPGRDPIVRVDDGAPITIPHGGLDRQVVQSLIPQLRRGQVARVRYHVWPRGAQDMIVDLDGFEAAWQQLQQEVHSPKPQAQR